MISYLRGTVAAFEEDKVIVDVGGVGYGVYMSGQAMGKLPAVGREVKLHTYLNVKEDAMQLYGFLTRDDLTVFKLLIGVNGIGPKGGLGVLAEKLILELRDKLKLEDALEHIAVDPGAAEGAAYHSEVQGEAVQALVALGYGSTEALRAVKQVDIGEAMEVEEVLKLALKGLS